MPSGPEQSPSPIPGTDTGQEPSLSSALSSSSLAASAPVTDKEIARRFYVILDGTGYYCDPTADRGGMNGHFLLTADELENMGGYEWDADFYRKLCRTSLDSSGSPNPR